MSESKKPELLRRKQMLFRFLDSMQKHKEYYADNDDDFEKIVDSILDQIIRLNYELNQFDFLN